MEKRTYALHPFGYVTKWLVSGPLDTPVDPATRTIVDQNAYEAYLKKNSHDDSVKEPPKHIAPGESGLAGMPWRYNQAGENCFVDASKFYFTIHKFEMWAATQLVAPAGGEYEADIWSYTATDLWVNGEHVFCEPVCAYRPMRRVRLTLRLRAGENDVFLRMQNSGVRDTRNIAALSFPGAPDIRCAYPGENDAIRGAEDAAMWLAAVRYYNGALHAPSAPPYPVSLWQDSNAGEKWTEGGTLLLPEGARSVILRLTAEGTPLSRTIEMSDHIVPPAGARRGSVEACRADYIRHIAEKKIPDRVSGNSNLFYTVYARMALGQPCGEDGERVVLAACDEAERNCDCSDFRLAYLLRALRQEMPLTEGAKEAIRAASLGYSYWSDEPAVGAMCYGSENHSLLFHTSQLLAGQMWPEETFARSGRTGREQEEIARRRIDDWMKKIETRGFSEFLSGGYTPITTAALLNVYDFGGDGMRERAGKLLDRIFYELALNAFDGIVCAPQGRIYRSVMTPWLNGTQGMFYYATGRGAPQFTEWMAGFAATGYRIPDDVYAHSKASGMTVYPTAGTRIQTYKSEGFMITSLPVPVVGEGAPGPFVPYASGYQQHLFYISLGGACNLFVNHPGGTHDGTQIRPGYWYGNGYFPSVAQYDNVLGAVYRIDADHPVPFVHMFFPEFCFDGVLREGNWIFARRGGSYVGVWCSRPLTRHDSDITQGCDLRAEGGSSGWLFVCGDASVASDFTAFRAYAKQLAPAFDEAGMALTFGGGKRVDFSVAQHGRATW